MGLIRRSTGQRLDGPLISLAPEDEVAFDKVVITGTYYEESIARGLGIYKFDTIVNLTASTPTEQIAIGFAEDATGEDDFMYTWVNGTWRAADL